jgi:hypothetical protein
MGKLALTWPQFCFSRVSFWSYLLYCLGQGTALKQVAWAFGISAEGKHPQLLLFANVLRNIKYYIPYFKKVVITPKAHLKIIHNSPQR